MSETRAVKAAYAVAGTDKPSFTGTAAVYNSPSQPINDRRIGKFTEIIKPGAFNRSLKSTADIKADVNHVPEQVIGRRSKGTLILSDSPTGLNVKIDPPDTSYARDAIEAVRSGNYDGMSIQFTVNSGGERFYRDADGTLIRELSDLNLERVSVVAEPAYTGTDVELRSVQEFVANESKPKEYYERQLAIATASL